MPAASCPAITHKGVPGGPSNGRCAQRGAGCSGQRPCAANPRWRPVGTERRAAPDVGPGIRPRRRSKGEGGRGTGSRQRRKRSAARFTTPGHRSGTILPSCRPSFLFVHARLRVPVSRRTLGKKVHTQRNPGLSACANNGASAACENPEMRQYYPLRPDLISAVARLSQ